MAKGFMDGYKTYDDSKGRGNPKEWRRTFNERIDPEEAAKILARQSETPYSILGVSERATQDEIKKAYRKKAMEWHPDKHPDNQEAATEMMKKINAAYSILYRN